MTLSIGFRPLNIYWPIRTVTDSLFGGIETFSVEVSHTHVIYEMNHEVVFHIWCFCIDEIEIGSRCKTY